MGGAAGRGVIPVVIRVLGCSHGPARHNRACKCSEHGGPRPSSAAGEWSAASSDNCPLWSARGAGVKAGAPRSGGERRERLDAGEPVRNDESPTMPSGHRGCWQAHRGRAPTPASDAQQRPPSVEPPLLDKPWGVPTKLAFRSRQVFPPSHLPGRGRSLRIHPLRGREQRAPCLVPDDTPGPAAVLMVGPATLCAKCRDTGSTAPASPLRRAAPSGVPP